MKFDFDWRVLRRPMYALGVIVVLIHLAIAIGAPMLAPFDPSELLGRRTQSPDAQFWLGTDALGRDYLSRLLYGGRMALMVTFSGVLISVFIGSLLGVLCAYVRGPFDQVVMRLVDVKLALPGILFIALFVTGFGESIPVLVVLIGIVYMPGVIRIVRAAAMTQVSRDYVRAAQLRGERATTILWREVYPNILDIVLVEFAIRMSSAVLLLSSMSFLGLGISPPTPDWGLMVSEGVGQMSFAPWLVLAPSMFIGTLVLGLNFGSEALASALGVDASRGNLG